MSATDLVIKRLRAACGGANSSDPKARVDKSDIVLACLRLEALSTENEWLQKALELISTVTEQRPVSGHQKRSCAWCNGSVGIAKQALAAGAERESLPLMARREGLPAWANFVAWDENGDCWAYENDPYRLAEWWTIRHNGRLREISGWYGWYPGDWRGSLHCAADTDEHGLKVVERTADMHVRHRYRTWDVEQGYWLYRERYTPTEIGRWNWQRIEDYRNE